MDVLPVEIITLILRSYLPHPDHYCQFENPLRNPNMSRATNRLFLKANESKCAFSCEGETFLFCRTRERCTVHADESVLDSLRTLDTSAKHAIEELDRYGIAYCHILDRDLLILGPEWHREIALPSGIIISGSCCEGRGAVMEAKSQFTLAGKKNFP